eukprot:TRINITY_DN48532_c0_g1_i8.p1 TRINITY_DN48532_c0_g1~~TRINITY_DN48532_c0_g1_i8.p1  ORF type:complete len:703 (-),score=113.81 TRINITY_DN48532_c0_g1_i8:317-2425(-)
MSLGMRPMNMTTRHPQIKRGRYKCGCASVKEFVDKDTSASNCVPMEYRVFVFRDFIPHLLNGAAKNCPESMLEDSTVLLAVTQMCWQAYAAERSIQRLMCYVVYVLAYTTWAFADDGANKTISVWWSLAGLLMSVGASILAEIVRQAISYYRRDRVLRIPAMEVVSTSLSVAILLSSTSAKTQFLSRDIMGWMIILTSVRFLMNEAQQFLGVDVGEGEKDVQLGAAEKESCSQRLARYFADDPPWNMLDVSTFSFATAAGALTLTKGATWPHACVSFTTLVFTLQWLRLAACLRCFDEVGPFITAIWKIIATMRWFLVVLLLLLVGPVLGWALLATRFPDGHFLQEEDRSFCEQTAEDASVWECGGGAQHFYTLKARLWASFTLMYRLGILGDFAGDTFALADYSGAPDDEPHLQTALIAWVQFIFVSQFYLIVLLNMLIAIMGDAYSAVLDKMQPVALRSKAKMCVETREELESYLFPDCISRLFDQERNGGRDRKTNTGIDEKGYIWMRFPQSVAANAQDGRGGLQTGNGAWTGVVGALRNELMKATTKMDVITKRVDVMQKLQVETHKKVCGELGKETSTQVGNKLDTPSADARLTDQKLAGVERLDELTVKVDRLTGMNEKVDGLNEKVDGLNEKVDHLTKLITQVLKKGDMEAKGEDDQAVTVTSMPSSSATAPPKLRKKRVTRSGTSKSAAADEEA